MRPGQAVRSDAGLENVCVCGGGGGGVRKKTTKTQWPERAWGRMVVLKSCRLIMMAISEVRSVKEDVDLAFPSLIVPAVSVDVKPTTFPKRVFDKTALTKDEEEWPVQRGSGAVWKRWTWVPVPVNVQRPYRYSIFTNSPYSPYSSSDKEEDWPVESSGAVWKRKQTWGSRP